MRLAILIAFVLSLDLAIVSQSSATTSEDEITIFEGGSGNLAKVACTTRDLDILVIATLDGSLIGVDHKTGDVRWKQTNEPRVKVSATSKNAILPVFLPDPKDGTLYSLSAAESKALKKLPFSVQQLVASSPCRSSDGIFYSGKKLDSWFTIDASTGEKRPLLTDSGETCPNQFADSLYFGRTVYNLVMFDGKSQNRHWNITYTDYSSHSLPLEELNSYAFQHMSSISSGRVRTIERLTGNLLWENDYGSPMIALYMKHGHDIIRLPFASFADSVLDSRFSPLNDQLLSTLYIGESDHGLYALPSLVDPSVPVLPDNIYPTRLLIGGPEPAKDDTAVILGHYRVNHVPKTQYLITGRSDAIIQPNVTSFNLTRRNSQVDTMERQSETWSSESKFLVLLVTALFVVVVTMFVYILAQVREIRYSSQGSSQGSVGPNGVLTMQKGVVAVGKISFDTQEILGKGCEGTFVFRGKFDGRSVAVKRLLPECFTVADREVQLLRESDAHPNVVRYFSTEEDSQFRYIALELCDATLQDYVEKNFYQTEVSAVEVLKQAISGLEHLHSLKIVHRDIKPHNILLSIGSSSPKMRVMISDFGLCKKLQNGRMSFSRRSGITGTEGWIAPEMMISNGRVMCAVDIFSMGCVFYYTIVKGKHPFGEPIRRQSNILTQEYKLNLLEGDDLWRTLILKMICSNPLDRPSASTVTMHPVFWDKLHVLTFFQDVSDRIEKETVEGEVLKRLEAGGDVVCRGDWKQYIDPEVSEDLGKYRSYRGDSIRDLLRALRNKKHHYRELNVVAQEKLGPSSESYVSYWLSRYPSLLYHTWSSMQFLKTEPAFVQYFDPHYDFPCNKTDRLPDWFEFNSKSPQIVASADKPRTPQRSRWKTRTGKKDENDSTASDKEAWIKSGEKAGAWRPNRVRDKKATDKHSDTENLVWKLS